MSFSGLRTATGACFAGLSLLMASCAKFEPQMDVANYGAHLPDFCENEGGKLSILESEAKGYGQLLAELGYLGEWDGLLHALMEHHFIWGEYDAAIRIGERYSEVTMDSDILEYSVARFLSEDVVSLSWLDSSRFKNAFVLDASEIEDSSLLGFDYIEDVFSFRDWASDPNGLDAVLIQASRLQKDGIEPYEKDAIVEALIPLFVEGELLDRFFSFANDGAPWSWDRWLKSSLLLESNARAEGELVLAGKLRAGRESVARRMMGTQYQQNWVPCVLEESGIFEGK